MRSRLLKGVTLATVVASLNGCGDLPVVGGLGSTLAEVAAPVLGLLDPVIGQFIPKPEPTPPPRPRPRPRRRPAAVAAANQTVATTPGATDSAVVAVVQTPQAAFAAWTERNRRFDKLRTDGLMQLYNGQTAGAIQSFREAQALRPQDPGIANLVAMAQNPGAFRKEDSGEVRVNGLPPMPGGASLTDALNALGGKGGVPQPPAPPGGDQPGGLF